MLIGRKYELDILERLYNSNSLQIACITGERNIGKTVLLKEFCKHKKALYFCVRQSMENANKSAFCAEIREQINISESIGFDWQKIIEHIVRLSCGEKIVLIIDDAQNLNSYFNSFNDYLLNLLPQFDGRLRLMIIFTGRDELQITVDKKFASIVHVTKIMIRTIPFVEACKFMEGFSNEDKILLYGITNGYSCYLQYIDRFKTLKDNLNILFYNPDAVLLNEAQKILEDKLREPATYNSILCSIACGAVRVNEISEAVGMECNKLSKYLSVLIQHALIERIVPVTEENEKKQHKKTYYKLTNTMLDFWYQFVFPYLSLIAMGKGSQLLRNKVMPKLDCYYAKIFNEVCMQQCEILRSRGNFMFNFQYIGYYWNNKITLENKLQLAYKGEEACLINCDWGRTKTDIDILQKMQEEHIEFNFTKMYYLLFSRKGFTDRLLANSASSNNIRLISLQYLK